MDLKQIKERFERRLLDEKETEFLISKVEEMQKTLEWISERCKTKHGYTIEDIEKRINECLKGISQ